MTDYTPTTIDESKFYMGVTAYLNDNAAAKASLDILAEVVPQLIPYTTLTAAQFDERKSVRESSEFKHIYMDAVYFSNEESFPVGTPSDRQAVSLQPVTVKGHDFLKLHIPAITPDAIDMMELIEDNLLPLLKDLFEGDLVSVKTKAGSTLLPFSELHDHTYINANQSTVTA